MNNEIKLKIDNLLSLLEYFLTPIAVYVSIALSVNLFCYFYPLFCDILLSARGDGGFWAMFGKWGILFICTILGAMSFSIYCLPLLFIGKLVRKLSPNKTYLKYLYVIIGILYLIYYLYIMWINIPIEFYEIVKLIISCIFIILIIIFLSFSALE